MWLQRTLDWVDRRHTGGARHHNPVVAAGQSMVEYAIVVALIAMVTLGAVQALGGGISNVFGNILKQLKAVG